MGQTSPNRSTTHTQGLSRWFSEFKHPALKCSRVGHRLQGEWRRGYIPSDGGYFGGVALRVKEMREVCARCGVQTEPWRPIEGESRTIHSLSAPESGWDQITAGGWWTDYGRCEPINGVGGASTGRGPNTPPPAGEGGR